MSKKILVIPLPENFWKAMALIVATGSTDALNIFKEEMQEQYEQDVIEFGAEVISLETASKNSRDSLCLCFPRTPELPTDKFKQGQELQVFVVKPKKPEGKDEKDKT